MSLETRVALLRGVNVGRGNRIAMADLRALAAAMGWRDVRSVIASGNLLFRAVGPEAVLAAELEAALWQATGATIPVLVLPGDRIVAAARDCPFQSESGNRVHGFFLWSPPVVDHAVLEAHRAPDEALIIGDGIAWLHAPSGLARSVLVERMSHVLMGIEMTGRNLNTIRKLATLVQAGLDGGGRDC